mgnify:CR=1 FL=1
MERRKFLSMTLGALALAAVPASVRAEDFRKTKPTVWTAHTVEDGIKNLYGSTTLIESGVKLKAAGESFDSGKKAVASSGGAIPVDFSTEIPEIGRASCRERV